VLDAVASGVKPLQPWDAKGFRIPGGGPATPNGMQMLMAANAMLREKTCDNYPAPKHILSCVYEGLSTNLDTGLAIEARYFTHLVMSPVSKNMIRSLFFGMNEANKLASRPAGVPPQKYTKIGMLGAGMMGAGIAMSTATAGIDIVLLDTSVEAAEKGKAYAAKQWGKQVAKGRMTQQAMDALLARIRPTADYADLKGCELVIEAVFEKREIKADVTRKTEAVIATDAIFASNTSTLPITGLAEASVRPANFIGLHFFSPAEKMPLVEIIVGKATSDATLARSMDYVRAIGKTPIVVNDSRGFYTSRVFGTYVSEGMALLEEGVPPALIDRAGLMAGMPVGPLALADEVSIELVHKIAQQTRADLGSAYVERAADRVAAKMVAELGRLGRKSGAGFYDYPADAPKRLWPGLAEQFPVKAGQADAGGNHRAPDPGAVSRNRALPRREGVARGYRRRCRRHPRLGLPALPRRADRLAAYAGSGAVGRRAGAPGGEMRAALRAAEDPARHGGEGRSLFSLDVKVGAGGTAPRLVQASLTKRRA
jgi:3-hydroxyacyl-CoA dehydrogenase/enoyl-CoA hydratase/3-hydroxybutyryl-CoA epimerase